MILNVDVEELKKKKDSLEAQLSQVTSMLSLIAEFATPIEVPSRGNGDRGEKQTYTREVGRLRHIVLTLSTGPAKETEIEAVLGWDRKRVHNTVINAISKGIVENTPGRLSLTEEGKRRAAWFASHPRYLVYTTGTKK